MNERLIAACKAGRSDEVNSIVSSKVIDVYDVKTLFHACQGGNLDIIKLIIKMCTLTNKGIEMERMWCYGLRGACKGNNIDIFKMYMHKIPPSLFGGTWCWFDNYCLQHVCETGNMKFIKFIIKKGYIGWHFGLLGACEGGHMKIVKYMTNKFTHYDKKKGCATHRSIYNINDCMMVACISGNIQIVKYLIKKIKYFKDTHDLERCLEYYLQYACRGGHVELIEYFMSIGAKDVNSAMETACRWGNIEIVKIMINNGATNWNQCLEEGCRGGYNDIVKLMILKGANAYNIGLKYACGGGCLEIVELMLKNGGIYYDEGLRMACSMGNIEIIKLMASKNIDLYSGLYNACFYEYVELAEMIISKDKNGTIDYNTILENACTYGNTRIVKLLVEKGANNWRGGLMHGCEFGKVKLVQLMLKYGSDTLTTSDLTEALKQNVRSHRCVEISILLISKGAVITAEMIKQLNKIPYNYHFTSDFKLYCLCCKYKYFSLNTSYYDQILKKYPAYILFVRCRVGKKCCINKLPTELFRLLFSY